MSELTVNLLDEHRSIHAQIHGAQGDQTVAALAADPAPMEFALVTATPASLVRFGAIP